MDERVIMVIPAHQRPDVLKKTVEHNILIVPECVIIGSGGSERETGEYLASKYAGIHYDEYPNNSLSAKWDYGYEVAYNLGADIFMHMGSDDFLPEGILDEALRQIRSGIKFTGCVQWWVSNVFTSESYRLRYSMYGARPNEPMGSGRFMTREIYERLDKQLWPGHTLSRGLDGAWYRRMRPMLKDEEVGIMDNQHIVLPKGDWGCINSWDKFVKCLERPDLIEILEHKQDAPSWVANRLIELRDCKE